jgi:hypothetical protein
MRQPPKSVRIFAEHSLPPSYRAQVLGDLQERFEQGSVRHATLRYGLDAVSVVGRVWWNCQSSARLLHSDLRKRAEAFQDSIWRRTIGHTLAFSAILIPLVVDSMVHATAVYARALHVFTLLFLAVWLRKQWTGCAPRQVPQSFSELELGAFHRAELTRHRAFMQWSYRANYSCAAAWLALWLPAKWTAIWTMPNFMWGLFVFPFGLMIAFLIPRTRQAVAVHLQKLQHEIDSLA